MSCSHPDCGNKRWFNKDNDVTTGTNATVASMPVSITAGIRGRTMEGTKLASPAPANILLSNKAGRTSNTTTLTPFMHLNAIASDMTSANNRGSTASQATSATKQDSHTVTIIKRSRAALRLPVFESLYMSWNKSRPKSRNF